VDPNAPAASPSPSPSATAPSPSPTAASPSATNASESASPAEVSPSPSQSAPSAEPSPTATVAQPKLPVQAADNNADFQERSARLDCTLAESRAGTQDDQDLWLSTCDRDGFVKYVLKPAFIKGTQITNAKAQLDPQTNKWSVSLSFDSAGSAKLAQISTEIYDNPSPQNQFAIVLDSIVYSAPEFLEPIGGGQAITGDFTSVEASDLANVLKFGSLPISLEVGQVTSVTPTVGSNYLHAGLLAGAIGLVLVALYLIAYYRALGFVAVASLLVAAFISYCLFVIFGRQLGFTLTLAGVAGAIVAIGITADSFIVYFERIRDEVREGRTLRVAADAGWLRARRTLLAADFVSFLGALVLYVLSIGSVRGFAFTLGVTTVVDVVVAFLYTRPVVAILAGTRWFQGGSKWTGVDPERLGIHDRTAPRPPAPAGRR
jgi:preprotein translocase subunit SecD